MQCRFCLAECHEVNCSNCAEIRHGFERFIQAPENRIWAQKMIDEPDIIMLEVSNRKHPAETQLVFDSLQVNNYLPERITQDRVRCKMPRSHSEEWKQAIGVMTNCHISINGA